MSPPADRHEKRKAPKPRGPRTYNGLVMDIVTTAAVMGDKSKNAKATRNMIERQLLPHRRLGGPRGRIVVLRSELEKWLMTLPGIDADTAAENLRARGAG